MAVFENFREWQEAVDKQIAQTWMANGGGLSYDPRNPELGVGHVFHESEDDGYDVRKARVDAFERIMDFIWADGPNPIRALRRLLVITRCGSPQHVLMMNQTEVAVLLNETRAATSDRELELWQPLMQAGGFFGVKRPGMKGVEAKKKYSRSAEGNLNRKGGKRAIRKFSALRREFANSQSKRNRKPNDNP